MRTILLIFCLFLSSCQLQQTQPNCEPEVRAAYDVGSGSTKMKVALVSPCQLLILSTLAEEQIRVDYKQDLEESKTMEFSDKIKREGLAALVSLKSSAETHKPSHHIAVATAAFRQAQNAEFFVKEIQSATAIEVKVISQMDEALLGYQSAKMAAQETSPIVWDIGGGSQQIIYPTEDGKLKVYTNELGAVRFKNLLIQALDKEASSPNPIGKDHIPIAIGLVEEYLPEFPDQLIRAIQREDHLLGIGGVHGHSISEQLDKPASYTANDLFEVAQERSGWTDQKIGGPFADTQVSNLILVYSIMNKYKIKQVSPIQVDLRDALLIQY